MVKIQRDIEIDAPREQVWSKLADLGGIEEWAAPIARSECQGEPGPDAVRRCEFADGGAIEERITGWSESEGLTYRITSENPVFDGAESTWRIDQAGEGTRVTYAMDVDPPEEAAKEAERELDQTAAFLLEALKTNVETGQVLEPPE